MKATKKRIFARKMAIHLTPEELARVGGRAAKDDSDDPMFRWGGGGSPSYTQSGWCNSTDDCD
jgi:hypothetical protein